MPTWAIPQVCTQGSITWGYRTHAWQLLSAGKASASLCLAAYSRKHLPFVHRASGSGTVTQTKKQSEGKREHVTEGHKQNKQRGRRKNSQHMQLAGSHRAYQTEIESRDTDITKVNRRQNPRGMSVQSPEQGEGTGPTFGWLIVLPPSKALMLVCLPLVLH